MDLEQVALTPSRHAKLPTRKLELYERSKLPEENYARVDATMACVSSGMVKDESTMVVQKPRSSSTELKLKFGPSSAYTHSKNLTIPLTRTEDWKTAAALCRGSDYWLLVATSGWTGCYDNDLHQLDSADWLDRVLQMCNTIGHEPDPDLKHDNGLPGSYNAS